MKTELEIAQELGKGCNSENKIYLTYKFMNKKYKIYFCGKDGFYCTECKAKISQFIEDKKGEKEWLKGLTIAFTSGITEMNYNSCEKIKEKLSDISSALEYYEKNGGRK